MPDTPTKDDQPTEHFNAAPEKADADALEVNEEDVDQSSPEKSFASTEDVEKQDDASSPNNAIVRRRYKKLNRPLYYIGGNNGTHIVDDFLSSLGWERISDKSRDDYKLKWCEIKSHNNYYSFREGEQLCYQIPNNKVLTTKIGLLTSLQEYDRVMNKVKKGNPRIMKYQDFFPETYRLDLKDERDVFCENYKDGEIWISKPTGLNQGKGIYLIRNREDIARVQDKMADIEEDVQNTRKLPFKIPMARIVQRYITNPLLLDSKKFDVRNFMLISSTAPFVVFYRDGYCRLTCMPYDERSTDMTGHLTNQFMQKKNPLYQEVKDETVWSMDRFNDYVNTHHMEKNNLPQDWVHTVLRKRCQQVMLHSFQSVRHKLECRLGFFDLYGCDFLVDDNFKVSLLEFNCNPALHTNCELLKEVIPSIVNETLKLSLEIFNKTKSKERLMPLASQENFVVLYNGDVIEAEERREKMRSAAEARKRARSAQRRKKFMSNFNFRYPFQNRRESDGEAEPTAVTSATSSSSSTNTTTTSNVVSSYARNHQHNTEVSTFSSPTTNASTHVTGSRSQTSLSTSSGPTAHSQSPPRVAQSRSMPNVTQKKPFYAGGSVPSRPYSAPRFHRKNTENRKSVSTNSQNRNSSNTAADAATGADESEENVVTEETIAASLDAKLKVYKRVAVPNSKPGHEAKGNSENASMQVPVQQRGRTRTRIPDLREQDTENIMFEEGVYRHRREESLDAIEAVVDEEEEDTGKLQFVSKRIAEAATVATQAPSAKLPQNYHTKVAVDNEFSKRYLAHLATSKKGQTKISKVNGSMKVFKTPLPSALPYAQQDDIAGILLPGESVTLQQKVQYRTPTTVRVRQTLQATTCTLEIGPKSRRGLVAVPTTASGTLLVQAGKTNASKNSMTKLRIINASGSSSSPSAEHELDSVPPPGVRLSLDDPQLQHMHLAQPSASAAADSPEPRLHHRVTSVDSSTQTPVSNSLSTEEKVIWRLRTRIGMNSNNARAGTKQSMYGQDHSKSTLPERLNGLNKTNMASPRYIAVRPALNTGVTIAISPPAMVSGKNMLPTIQEGKGSGDLSGRSSHTSLRLENSLNPTHSSRHSQTQSFDLGYELPSGTTVRTILDGVARAKFESNPEKWMTAG